MQLHLQIFEFVSGLSETCFPAALRHRFYFHGSLTAHVGRWARRLLPQHRINPCQGDGEPPTRWLCRQALAAPWAKVQRAGVTLLWWICSSASQPPLPHPYCRWICSREEARNYDGLDCGAPALPCGNCLADAADVTRINGRSHGGPKSTLPARSIFAPGEKPWCRSERASRSRLCLRGFLAVPRAMLSLPKHEAWAQRQSTLGMCQTAVLMRSLPVPQKFALGEGFSYCISTVASEFLRAGDSSHIYVRCQFEQAVLKQYFPDWVHCFKQPRKAWPLLSC